MYSTLVGSDIPSLCLVSSALHVFNLSRHLQVDEMFRGAPIDDGGHFDYREYTRVLKHGSKEEES